MNTNPLQTMTVKTRKMGGRWSWAAADSFTRGGFDDACLSSLAFLAAAAAVEDRVLAMVVEYVLEFVCYK